MVIDTVENRAPRTCGFMEFMKLGSIVRSPVRFPTISVLLGLIAMAGLFSVGRQGVGSQKRGVQSPAKSGPVATDERETLPIAGRLIDKHGEPVAKARVWLVVEEKWENSWQGPPVIADSFSTDSGHFELQPLKSKVNQFVKGDSTTFQIWVWKSHFALTRHVTHRKLPGKPVEIRMLPEPKNEFQLRNPDGSPCTDATVTVSVVKFPDDDYQSVPETIRRRFEVNSGIDGKFMVRGVGRDHVVSLHFMSPQWGAQSYGFHGRGRRIPTQHTLRRTGSITGRLILPPESRADLSQVNLRVATLESTKHGLDETRAAFALVQPDRSGQFAIPAIAAGTIRVFCDEPDGFGFRYDSPPEELSVKPGFKAKLEISMSPAVLVTRQLREAVTRKPLPGIRAHLQHGNQNIQARTDQEGRFSAWILPGVRYHTVYDYPDEYIIQLRQDNEVTQAPAGVVKHELPPIELLRGRTIEGTVVDPSGHPLADVRVGANWKDPREDFGFAILGVAVNARRWGTTNSEGHFRITGIFPQSGVTLTPVRAEVILGPSVSVAADDLQAVRMETNPFDFISLTGRIVDMAAKPIAGAEVLVQLRESDKTCHAWRAVTDAQGKFTTPAHFPREFKYRIMVQSQFQDVAASPWQSPVDAGQLFPDFAVDRSKLVLHEIDP